MKPTEPTDLKHRQTIKSGDIEPLFGEWRAAEIRMYGRRIPITGGIPDVVKMAKYAERECRDMGLLVDFNRCVLIPFHIDTVADFDITPRRGRVTIYIPGEAFADNEWRNRALTRYGTREATDVEA